MKVDISIVIINYNTFSLTCNCIESIIRNERQTSYEIIIVDNHSIERDSSDFLTIFPQVKLISCKENVGFAKGSNLGIEKAEGDFILLLNSDTLLLNDAIACSLKYLQLNNNVAVATCRLEYENGQVQHNCQRFPSIRYLLFELLRLQKIFSSKKHTLFGAFFDYNTVAHPDWVWGTFFMFRKELIGKLPGKKLADDFFMYGEDMQWCMEFKHLGYEIAFLPDARVVHLMGASGGKKNVMMNQNLDVFMHCYYPGWKRFLIRMINILLTGKYAH